MNKRALKFFSKFFSKTWVKVAFYFVGILLIFFISGVFDDPSTSFRKIGMILSSQETISVFLAGILSLGLAKLLKKCDYYLEESLKIDDDHHKIIAKYSAHERKDIDDDDNYADKTGVLMHLRHIKTFRKSDLKNKEKDIYSKAHQNLKKDIDHFKEGKLYLPSVNVFTNVKGNTKIVFQDSAETHLLPDFIIEHADELLFAHKNSQKRNNNTVRLNDFSHKGNTLTLETMRSTYYHMLITNRCMDYDFANGLSVRDLYEYNKRITSLKESKFGNQIGINGLIISKDGYVLVEKRDHHKTTWKNKFGQSISLALKEEKLKLGPKKVLEDTYKEANEKLKAIIEETIEDNFGLKADKFETFSLETNFLGLARDLLEGGKPNLYFYMVAKDDAKDLLEDLLEKAKEDDPEKALSTDKLESDYYLIPFEDIAVNFQYMLRLDRRKIYKVERKVYPRTKWRKAMWDKVKYAVAKKCHPAFTRECGEALLVTLSYLEICKDRIAALNKDKEAKNDD